MCSRGKKLVMLSLNVSNDNSQTPEEGISDLYNNLEEFNEEDPWMNFNTWREAQQNKVRRVDGDEVQNCIQDLENPVLQELSPVGASNYDGPGYVEKSVNGCVSEILDGTPSLEQEKNEESIGARSEDSGDLSISWKPDEENEESISDDNSQSSEIIPKLPPILFKHSQDATRKSINRTMVEHSLRKGRVWDKKDRCLYCSKDITNFSRHLFRKHASEESVQKILQQPKGDLKRKHMIDLLRKQGNFSIIGEQITRPVQRPTPKENENDVLPTDFLPCKYCKGLYKRKSLRRHALSCYFNNEVNIKKNFASEGQTMLAFTESRQGFLKNLRLKSEVFDKMHADRISLNAKSDPIICQYAEDYLRKHKRPHIKNATSNKMRELGRLLIPMQDIYKINSMIEMLKPEHFDKVVSASRIISGYNESTRSFQAPSLALHMKTILLAVCSSARSLLLKKNPVLAVTNYEVALKNIKAFRELVDANWKFEMGSLALKDLNEKHSVNPQKLPVTQDIILFKNYTQNIADTCMNELKTNPEDKQSFRKLTEACLALTIILNRKRIGDVQYTKLESYTRETTSNNQEECLDALTETEKELSKHFKRIITVGKGSRSVPILFSKQVQEYMKTLLSVRGKTTFIPKENPFLFALTGSISQWVDGSAVLKKFAVKCGAKNPGTLTSSRLRKQIATVLQILNLNEMEMEQVASFMGHTKKTHERFYRPENTVFTGVEVTDDRIFIATPRLRAGVPATFSSIPRNSHRGSSPILQAFPNWSLHGAGRGDFNCSGLISVYRSKTDSCNRLWVLDSGLDTSIDNFRRVCPPKLLVFDLRSDQIVRTIIIPEDVLRPVSALTNLILDESVQGKCDAAFVYISDTVAAGLIVYDAAADKTWRFSDPSMFPNPDYSKMSIVGEDFSLMDGVIGLAHSPKLATLFYQPMATDRIFSIPTSTLTKGPPGEFEELPISVAGRKSSQGLPLAMNQDDNTLYFSPMTETSVASWNVASNQQEILANDPVNLQFVADIRWKEDGTIYLLSSRFHKFFRRTVNPNEINLRLLKITPQKYAFHNFNNNFYY